MNLILWVFVRSCGRILPQNERETPVDSGLLRLRRRSEIARESGMIPPGIDRRNSEADPGFDKTAPFA